MLSTMIRFYWDLFWLFVLPGWIFCTRPDPGHFHRRRFTSKYRTKQRIVLHLWGGVATVTIFVPVVPLVVSICLLAAFLSLAILDETA